MVVASTWLNDTSGFHDFMWCVPRQRHARYRVWQRRPRADGALGRHNSDLAAHAVAQTRRQYRRRRSVWRAEQLLSGQLRCGHGAPRPAFGTGGIQVFRMSGDPAAQESINALATDRFGRLHTAGSCHPNLDTALDFCVARLAQQALDTNFGPGTGWVSTSFAADKLDDAANALLVQLDGKLLAAGSCRISPNVYGLCLARYLGNGSPDTTFDAAFAASGKVVTAPATPSRQCDPLAGAAT